LRCGSTQGRRETAWPRLRTLLGVLRAGLIIVARWFILLNHVVATQIESRRSSVIVLVDNSSRWTWLSPMRGRAAQETSASHGRRHVTL